VLFELRIQFTGEEGDEVPVVDLMPEFAAIIARNTNVELLPMELRIYSDKLRCPYEGRQRAARN